MRGIRTRLLLLLGSLIVLGNAIQFAASFSFALSQTNRLFDAQMQQVANSLRSSNSADNSDQDIPVNYDLVIQVWRADQVHVIEQRPYRVLPKRAPIGYSTVHLDNGDWRVFAAATATGEVQVAQKLDARRTQAVDLAVHTLRPILVMSIVLLLAMWWVVTVTLRPLAQVQKQLAQRDGTSLEPVDRAGAPVEVTPLLDAMNDLLQRVSASVSLQRQFVADAAHELRSPLTVLKVQMQLLGRNQPEASRQASLAALAGAIARSERMVEQLLALARQDALAQAQAGGDSVDLSQCALDAIAEVAVFAAGKQVELNFLDSTPVTVHADADSIMILMRNLLDNAVRYTPSGGAVNIGVERQDGLGVLTIADSGAGIPEADLARVTDRFYRVPGTSESGSGLGLSIVSMVVARLGASMQLRNSANGGLVVRIGFQRAAG
jgi:two-component system OmpR family sensor kinase